MDTVLLESGIVFDDLPYTESMFNQFCEDWDHSTTYEFDYDQYISEKGPITPKNIFKRLVDLCKKIWKAILEKCGKFVNFLGSFYRGKKHKNVDTSDKTLDEICEFVVGKSDKLSTKHVSFTTEGGGKIKFNMTKASLLGTPKGGIEGHDKKERPEQRLLVLTCGFIKKPESLQYFCDVLDDIKNTKGNTTMDIKKALDAITMKNLTTYLPKLSNFFVEITMEEFTRFNDAVTKFMKALETVDDQMLGALELKTDEGGKKMKQNIIEFMNKAFELGKYVQKVVNAVGDGIKQMYTIDGKYEDTINSKNFRDKLPKFIKTCVDCNLPSKYVAYGVRFLSDKSINGKPGKDEKGDVNKAQGGNGRLVMIPSAQELKGKIIKIGYNGLGARSNRNEFMVWDKVKGIPEIADQLYKIEDIGDKDYYVILGQAAAPIEYYKDAVKWSEEMGKLCIKHKLPYKIRCNEGGFGKINGKVVCLDYGTVKPA